ncbi:hypothetical protein [Rhodobacter sp. Har01]|nr:hypothetical protein [Rhodobacter sp. Har01]
MVEATRIREKPIKQDCHALQLVTREPPTFRRSVLVDDKKQGEGF